MGKGNTLAGKKTPTRQCIGCGDKKDKKELIRVIKTPEGEITVDNIPEPYKYRSQSITKYF